MSEIIFVEYLPIFIKLAFALVLGLTLGLERTFAGKMAGMRTYALVSLGSCLLILVSESVILQHPDLSNFDPLRVAAGIVMGIGFLCGGIIIFKEKHLEGLTTAAGLWVSTGIGIAVGYGLFAMAAIATFFTFFILNILWKVEARFEEPAKKSHLGRSVSK